MTQPGPAAVWYNRSMKRAMLFAVVPLAVLIASLWAVPFLLPTVLPRPTMTKAERIEADQAAIAIAAEMARKQRQRKEQEAAFNKLLDSIPVAEPETKPDAEPTPVKRFATVEAYFSDGNPNPQQKDSTRLQDSEATTAGSWEALNKSQYRKRSP